MAVGKGSMDRAAKAVKTTEAEKKKTAEKKTTTKKAIQGTQKAEVKGEKEVTTSVIGATDPQVMDMVEKSQEEKKQEKTGSAACGIGDEMPVYFY